MVSELPGRLYVVATPIGNLEDISPRAVRILSEVETIACEDTRHTAKICNRFGIKTRRISLHAHNEASRIPKVLELLRGGSSLALVSDAGTPLVSDPGERLVAACIEEGVEVVPVPGPSAILAALVASGLPTHPFAFVGFLPRKGRSRSETLERLAEFPGTLVLFEAPGRVAATLIDVGRVLGRRRLAVACELTKLHEQMRYGWLGDPIDLGQGKPRGEYTIVIEGPIASKPAVEPEDLDDRIQQLRATGLTDRDIARQLALEFGVGRTGVYRHLLSQASGRETSDPEG